MIRHSHRISAHCPGDGMRREGTPRDLGNPVISYGRIGSTSGCSTVALANGYRARCRLPWGSVILEHAGWRLPLQVLLLRICVAGGRELKAREGVSPWCIHPQTPQGVDDGIGAGGVDGAAGGADAF